MKGQTVGGRYALRREIGRGGMGIVWEAFDQMLRRPVALKRMMPENVVSFDARRSFEQEATTVARLRNEHIVQVHDYGIDEGSPYLVMELLEGEDLESRLRRTRQLPAAAVLSLLRQLSSGLEAASAAGIVHCDLKPANIFLARGASGESVKILDFGVGWRLFDARDWSGTRIGTPAYMSPEQVRGAVPHPLADLWSLGVIAYRALTGRFPFSTEDLAGLIISICADPFPPPSSLDATLLPGFDRFFERALAKDRTRRFQSSRELITAFAAVCDAGSKPAKILIVDDEPDMQLLLKMHFRQNKKSSAYELIFADNGQHAIEELRRHPDIDVVVADINMPVMDGITLLERIPEVNPLARTVIVSAYGDMTNIRRAMNRGAFDFLFKPLDFADLETTLEKSLRSAEQQRQKAQANEENDILRKFTNAALVERLRALGPAGAAASEALEATVAFIDVFRFTRVAQERPPAEATRLLNANFEVIVPELLAQGGIVDKFMGDAVMAVFHGPEHLDRALSACIAVREQLATVARRTGNDSPYAHGVCAGVSTGSVLAAEVGSHACARLGYTVLGQAVNAASHLARAALSGEILVDEAVCRAARQEFKFESAGARSIWPRGESTTVYRVAGRDVTRPLLEGEQTVQISLETRPALASR
ncbi:MULTISPECIES: protein kinase domain-containing protein [Sorangium]|uniref:Protein kinase n=1 Tax=Sorangium cellulosum (strain So ce56) TaxID=448385 RepID=A9G8I3_SORC5|nr:response regulator [Sorangium cellulosum]CAN95997.1 Protein kinase [Sorangium cellulosum So ce56]